jgi:hypothetical protein
MVNIAKAIRAPTRLTKDSSASESRPTERVSKYATVFSKMVKTAAAIEIQIKYIGDRFRVSIFVLIFPLNG